MNDIIQMIKQNEVLKIGLILLGVYLVMTFINKSEEKETMHNSYIKPKNGIYEYLDNVDANDIVNGSVQQDLAQVKSEEQTHLDSVVSGSDALKTGDLLPKYDEANEFAKQNPVSDLLKEQNFLISGYSMGINTVMQSNKIKNHDLRSTPPIPKDNTLSVWNQSSYETPSGAGRRMLEIGAI